VKKILFLTGTRADFGKLKSLIHSVDNHPDYKIYIFVTGMHLLKKYGFTASEVEKEGFNNLYFYINQNNADTMDVILAKTIIGLSDYTKQVDPDMIVVHGDRVEAMAGAIVGSLNNILVSHIEGGEVSGTIDELIRHSVSKLAHLHFVANKEAENRLLQLGEDKSCIRIIGSPDLDIMSSDSLPSIELAKERYNIEFETFSIFIYHPVTTETDQLEERINQVVSALEESGDNFIIVYPNNDHGSDVIISAIQGTSENKNFKIFPSIRFEYFLTLLKNASYIIGNSSAGIREAPYYGLPTINIGSRQNNRSDAASIINVNETTTDILSAILQIRGMKTQVTKDFGSGQSATQFLNVLNTSQTWETAKQKVFIDKK